MMLHLVEYDLRTFKKNFNEKTRKQASDKVKFKTVKKELLEHIHKVVGEEYDLHIFKDLNIFIEGYSLCFSYIETTDQPMTIRLKWKVNELTEYDITRMVNDFCVKNLKIDDIPKIQITDSFMYQNLALYWPKDKQITISLEMIHQFSPNFVLSVIKHEILHHYLTIKGKDASDTSMEFISLLIKYNAYISKAPDAQVALQEYLKINSFKNPNISLFESASK